MSSLREQWIGQGCTNRSRTPHLTPQTLCKFSHCHRLAAAGSSGEWRQPVAKAGGAVSAGANCCSACAHCCTLYGALLQMGCFLCSACFTFCDSELSPACRSRHLLFQPKRISPAAPPCQVSGVRFSFDPSLPPGRRVLPGSVTVGDAPLQPGAIWGQRAAALNVSTSRQQCVQPFMLQR